MSASCLSKSLLVLLFAILLTLFYISHTTEDVELIQQHTHLPEEKSKPNFKQSSSVNESKKQNTFENPISAKPVQKPAEKPLPPKPVQKPETSTPAKTLDSPSNGKTADEIRQENFENIYKSNSWGDKESLSGPGSSMKYTENVRKLISHVIKEYEIRSFLDAPCGGKLP